MERPVIGWGIVKRGYENLNNSRGEWGMDKKDAVELLIVDSEGGNVCSVDDASRAQNLILVTLEPNETITDEELLAFVNEKRSAAIEKRVEEEIAAERLAEQEGALSPHDANLSPAQLARKAGMGSGCTRVRESLSFESGRGSGLKIQGQKKRRDRQGECRSQNLLKVN